VPAHPHPPLVTWTPVDGVRLHALVRRPRVALGPPVLMLHGLGVSASSLGPLAERLAEERLTVVPDLPGFGRSDAAEVWSTRRIAAGIDRFMSLRGLPRAVLVGHSYGCHVAVLLAERHPERVAALVLLSPAFDRRFGGGLAQALRLAIDAPMERPSLVAGGLRDYLRAGPRRVIGTMREAARIPLEDLLKRIDAPILVMRGSRDPLTTARWAGDLHRSARRAAIATIPRAAHGLGHDAPTAVAGAIRQFLDEALHSPRMPRRALTAG
jgi:2-hydroxy-6-oxonona-2,4-dienedioate hydrolase